MLFLLSIQKHSIKVSPYFIYISLHKRLILRHSYWKFLESFNERKSGRKHEIVLDAHGIKTRLYFIIIYPSNAIMSRSVIERTHEDAINNLRGDGDATIPIIFIKLWPSSSGVDERRFKTKPLVKGNLCCDPNIPFPSFYYIFKSVFAPPLL